LGVSDSSSELGLASSGFTGISLGDSDSFSIHEPVSTIFPSRPLVDSRFSSSSFISDTSRSSFSLVLPPSGATTSSSSLAISSAPTSGLAVSAIEKSLVSSASFSPPLEVSSSVSLGSSASPHADSYEWGGPLPVPLPWGRPTPPPHPDEGLEWSNTTERWNRAEAYCDLPKSSRSPPPKVRWTAI
jgi:hypothetical protein